MGNQQALDQAGQPFLKDAKADNSCWETVAMTPSFNGKENNIKRKINVFKDTPITNNVRPKASTKRYSQNRMTSSTTTVKKSNSRKPLKILHEYKENHQDEIDHSDKINSTVRPDGIPLKEPNLAGLSPIKTTENTKKITIVPLKSCILENLSSAYQTPSYEKVEQWLVNVNTNEFNAEESHPITSDVLCSENSCSSVGSFTPSKLSKTTNEISPIVQDKNNHFKYKTTLTKTPVVTTSKTTREISPILQDKNNHKTTLRDISPHITPFHLRKTTREISPILLLDTMDKIEHETTFEYNLINELTTNNKKESVKNKQTKNLPLVKVDTENPKRKRNGRKCIVMKKNSEINVMKYSIKRRADCRYNLRQRKGIKREQISSFNMEEKQPQKTMKLKGDEVMKNAEETLVSEDVDTMMKNGKATDLVTGEIKESNKLDLILKEVNKSTVSSKPSLQLYINQSDTIVANDIQEVRDEEKEEELQPEETPTSNKIIEKGTSQDADVKNQDFTVQTHCRKDLSSLRKKLPVVDDVITTQSTLQNDIQMNEISQSNLKKNFPNCKSADDGHLVNSEMFLPKNKALTNNIDDDHISSQSLSLKDSHCQNHSDKSINNADDLLNGQSHALGDLVDQNDVDKNHSLTVYIADEHMSSQSQENLQHNQVEKNHAVDKNHSLTVDIADEHMSSQSQENLQHDQVEKNYAVDKNHSLTVHIADEHMSSQSQENLQHNQVDKNHSVVSCSDETCFLSSKIPGEVESIIKLRSRKYYEMLPEASQSSCETDCLCD